MSTIPRGSLVFTGVGESGTMKFHAPTGVDLGQPASAPVPGDGVGLLCTLPTSHRFTVVGGNTPHFGTTGVGTFNPDFTFLAQYLGSPAHYGGIGAGVDSSDNFYSIRLTASPPAYDLVKYDKDCNELATWLTNPFAPHLSAVRAACVSWDGATLYTATYDNTLVTPHASKVYAYNMSGSASLGVFVDKSSAGVAVQENAILCLANGDVLIGWTYIVSVANGYVEHYNAAGTLLHTYTLPSGSLQAPLYLVRSLTPTTSFWANWGDTTAPNARGVFVAEIELGTGTYLHGPWAPDDGAGFKYDSSFAILLEATAVAPVPLPTPKAPQTPCYSDLPLKSGGIGASGCNVGGVGWTSGYAGPYGAVAKCEPEVNATVTLPSRDLSMFDVFGLACPFDVIADPDQHNGEHQLFVPGCFGEAIARGDARLLLDHDERIELARQRDGSLELWQDGTGLMFGARLPTTRRGALVLDNVARGWIAKCCIYPRAAVLMERLNGQVRLHRVGRFDLSLLLRGRPSFPDSCVQVNEARLRSRLSRAIEHA